MKHIIPFAVTSLFLAGCAAVPDVRPPAPQERTAASFPVRPVAAIRGLDAVIGKDAGALKRMFGEPRLDVVEVYGRKLQFVGKSCILDAFLYPDRKGHEVVTYVDARRSDGAIVDRASCVEALQRR